MNMIIEEKKSWVHFWPLDFEKVAILSLTLQNIVKLRIRRHVTQNRGLNLQLIVKING